MDPYNQPFAAEAAWYYAGTREPFVPVAPQQLLSQHPQQPWSSAGPRSHIQTEFDASTAAYDVADPTTSFAVSEGSYGPDRGVPLGTGSESSSPSHYIGYNQEPRRIRIKRIRTVREVLRKSIRRWLLIEAQACEECRKRKQRCDGSESCAACEEQGTICRYRDVPPAK
jgi:hypothetical protein